MTITRVKMMAGAKRLKGAVPHNLNANVGKVFTAQSAH